MSIAELAVTAPKFVNVRAWPLVGSDDVGPTLLEFALRPDAVHYVSVVKSQVPTSVAAIEPPSGIAVSAVNLMLIVTLFEVCPLV
jgi:hypothetical protein